ncbi:MAG: hypothetical protein LBN95_11640 [Prevotellaceae bacterium]|nr:hypothetical protein [Prevotellaceae bacterium]
MIYDLRFRELLIIGKKIKSRCHCGLDPQSIEKHLQAIAGQARNDTV